MASVAAVFAIVLTSLYAPTLWAPFPPTEGLALYAAKIDPNIDSVWGLARAVLEGVGVSDRSR